MWLTLVVSHTRPWHSRSDCVFHARRTNVDIVRTRAFNRAINKTSWKLVTWRRSVSFVSSFIQSFNSKLNSPGLSFVGGEVILPPFKLLCPGINLTERQTLAEIVRALWSSAATEFALRNAKYEQRYEQIIGSLAYVWRFRIIQPADLMTANSFIYAFGRPFDFSTCQTRKNCA